MLVRLIFCFIVKNFVGWSECGCDRWPALRDVVTESMRSLFINWTICSENCLQITVDYIHVAALWKRCLKGVSVFKRLVQQPHLDYLERVHRGPPDNSRQRTSNKTDVAWRHKTTRQWTKDGGPQMTYKDALCAAGSLMMNKNPSTGSPLNNHPGYFSKL